MGKATFKSLVEASGELLRRSPASHARRLRLMALLGLAYPYLFALSCLILCVLFAFGSLLYDDIFLAVLAGLALGFLIRFATLLHFAASPPEGLELTRKDAPALFMELDAVAQALGARLPSKILLDHNFNSSYSFTPGRLHSLLSPGRDYLVLGLPLMAALSPRLFRSVLAHELAHCLTGLPSSERLSRRALLAWLRIDAYAKTPGVFLARPFLGLFSSWYLPRLNALLAPLSFEAEYSADAKAASVSGRDAAALALASVSILSSRVARDLTIPFWERARTSPEPRSSLLKGTLQHLRSNKVSEAELAAFFEKAPSMRGIDGDSHPSMGERIVRLGYGERLPDLSLLAAGPDSAQTLLGSFEDAAFPKLDALWRKQAESSWSSVYGQSQAARAVLSSMGSLNAKEIASIEVKLQRARILEIACGPDAAIRPLEDILEESPSCSEAKLLLGHAKLALGKPGGEELMLEAFKERPELVFAGFEELAQLYRVEGRGDAYARLLEMRESVPAPSKDGKAPLLPQPPSLKASSTLSTFELSEAEKEEIVRVISENGSLEAAYLALVTPKPGKDAEEPFHALLVVRKFSLLAYRGENDSALALELAASLAKHSRLKVVPLDVCPLPVRLKLKFVKKALIYKS